MLNIWIIHSLVVCVVHIVSHSLRDDICDTNGPRILQLYPNNNV